MIKSLARRRTKDGVSWLEIELKDAVEKRGAQMVKEVAVRLLM